MIQLSTLPLTGAIPGVRAVGFPLGTTSDFALALADLASAPGLVVAPAAPPGGTARAAATEIGKRQLVAGGGKDVPVAGFAITVESPLVALPIGDNDESVAPDAAVADLPSDPPIAASVETPVPDPTPVIDTPVPRKIALARASRVAVAALAVSLPRVRADATPADSAAPKPDRAAASEAEIARPTTDGTPAAVADTGSVPVPVPAPVPVPVAVPVAIAAQPPVIAPDAPAPSAIPATAIAQAIPAVAPVIAGQPPVLSAVTAKAKPRAVLAAPLRAIDPPSAPLGRAEPALANAAASPPPPATSLNASVVGRAHARVGIGQLRAAGIAIPARLKPPSAVIPERLTPRGVAVPIGLRVPATPAEAYGEVPPAAAEPSAAVGVPAAIAGVVPPADAPIATALVETSSVSVVAATAPKHASASSSIETRAPAIAGLATPRSETAPTSDLAPVAATAPPAISAMPIEPELPPRTAAIVERALAAPVAVAPTPASVPLATAAAAAAVSPPVVAGDTPRPLARGTMPAEHVRAPDAATAPMPVTVTVVALPATPPAPPPLQPAAQAFAAAMFAAAEPIDDRGDASVDDLPFGLVTAAAPTALHAPALAVPGVASGQQPALDMARDDWMASMIDRIETLRDDSGGVRETRMKLAPEALGQVEVSVRRDEQGVMQVRIAADTPQARALLADAAPRLAELAEARGVKLGGSSVDAGVGSGASSADQGRRDAPAPAPIQRRAPAVAANDTTDTTTDSRLA